MKTKNKKGFEVALRTVTLISLLLIALTTIAGYFTGTFELAGKPVGEAAGEGREQAGEFSIVQRLKGVRTAGACTGTPEHTTCGHYYEEDLSSSGAECAVPSCMHIGGYPVDKWGTVTTYYDCESSRWCGCETFDYTGNGRCIPLIERYPYYGDCGSCDGSASGCDSNRNVNIPVDTKFDSYLYQAECTFSCSDLSDAGKTACECAGCVWES